MASPPPLSPSNDDPATWWGQYTLAEQQAARWRVGPSTVWVARSTREWRFVHLHDTDPMAHHASVDLPLSLEAFRETQDSATPADVTRFSFQQTEGDLHVLAALPDRPVVVRPETPLYVPAGETVTLYISVPLWLRFEVGAVPRMLREAPSFRLSDTWFGPNTREGELCYATQTSGRFDLADVPLRLHRAITPVLIHNRATDTLFLERVRLPVEYLSLYEAPDHFLWTQTVTFTRESSGDLANLKMEPGPPAEAPEATLLRAPRQTTRGNVIARTFSSLLHL